MPSAVAAVVRAVAELAATERYVVAPRSDNTGARHRPRSQERELLERDRAHDGQAGKGSSLGVRVAIYRPSVLRRCWNSLSSGDACSHSGCAQTSPRSLLELPTLAPANARMVRGHVRAAPSLHGNNMVSCVPNPWAVKVIPSDRHVVEPRGQITGVVLSSPLPWRQDPSAPPCGGPLVLIRVSTPLQNSCALISRHSLIPTHCWNQP